MKKIKYFLPLFGIFLYLTIPSRALTLLPKEVINRAIAVFESPSSVQIEGYKVYNAGIFPLEDGYLYVTRKSGKTIFDAFINRFILKKNVKWLEIGELDKTFVAKAHPKSVYKTEEFVYGCPVQYIDPRLFKHGDDIYMLYCRQITRKDKSQSEARLQLARLEKKEGLWIVASDVEVSFDSAEEFYEKGLVNRNFEKNWMPFSKDNKLYFVYLMQPEHILLHVDTKTGKAVVHSRVQSPFPEDSFQLRGSTPAVFDEELGEWLTIYHFVYPTVRNTGKKALAYFMGAYTFSDDYPHNILRKTPEALTGTNLYDNYRKFVFPTSLIRDKEDYLIFYGDDDVTNKVVRVSRKMLIDSMQPAPCFEADPAKN